MAWNQLKKDCTLYESLLFHLQWVSAHCGYGLALSLMYWVPPGTSVAGSCSCKTHAILMTSFKSSFKMLLSKSQVLAGRLKSNLKIKCLQGDCHFWLPNQNNQNRYTLATTSACWVWKWRNQSQINKSHGQYILSSLQYLRSYFLILILHSIKA